MKKDANLSAVTEAVHKAFDVLSDEEMQELVMDAFRGMAENDTGIA